MSEEFTLTVESESKKIGQKIGTSDWIKVTQDMITQFGLVTLDPDPMHIDPEWCKENSAFGEPISFGFLTLSLITNMVHNIDGFDMEHHKKFKGFGVNYGSNRVRLISPVRVNKRIRMHSTLIDVVERKPGQLLRTFDIVVEIEGEEKPAMVGEMLALWISDPEAIA